MPYASTSVTDIPARRARRALQAPKTPAQITPTSLDCMAASLDAECVVDGLFQLHGRHGRIDRPYVGRVELPIGRPLGNPLARLLGLDGTPEPAGPQGCA